MTVASVGQTGDLWRWVDDILALCHRQPELSEMARGFELTRDQNLDRQQHYQFSAAITQQLAGHTTLRSMPPNLVGPVIERVYDELLGISVLGPLWRSDDVTEILVDGWDRVRVEVDGQIKPTNITFRNLEHGVRVAREMAAKVSDRTLTPTNPYVTAELPGARVTLLIDRIVKSRLAVTIRKFRPLMGMDGLLRYGSLTQEMAEFLADAVRVQSNILISGSTGTGKTTMINALSESIPAHERVITIEDSYELSLRVDNWVALQSIAKASADDSVHVDLARLLVESLRMRPDRIIVGEIREADAAAVMLEAANTGHEGTMTTIHAESASRAVNFRLANWVRAGAHLDADLAVAEIANAFHLVVQIRRSRFSGARYVSEIAALDVDKIRHGQAQLDLLWEARPYLDDNDQEHIEHRRVQAVPEHSDLGARLRAMRIERWFTLDGDTVETVTPPVDDITRQLPAPAAAAAPHLSAPAAAHGDI